ncbi:MAG TPA: hypothetical protein VN848_12770 [Gemmatimonadales bacterium]|nr:hypothetical protein [Gemmatimonadales bacterium]
MTTLIGAVDTSQDIAFRRLDEPWRPFAGDPTPLLSGDSELEREINALYEDWRKRMVLLHEAERAPEDARQGVIALHEAFLAELDRAAQAGEGSTLVRELKEKRDAAETEARGADFQAAIDAAARAVEHARERYVSHLEQNWPALIAAKRAEAAKVAADHAKAYEELQRKLAPIQARWASLWEDSRAIVGHIHDFTLADLPPLNDFGSAPIPSAEAIERNGGSVSAPTPPAPSATSLR